MSDVTESGLPPEVEAKLKADGVDYIVVKTVVGALAFRGLKRAEYQRFQAMIRDPKAAPNAAEQVCSFAILHPSQAAFQAFLEKKPGILAKCSDAVLEFSGVDIDAETKKYESV